MNEEQENDNENKTIDPMLAAYFDGSESDSEQEEQNRIDEEGKAKEQAEQEAQEKLEAETQQKEQEEAQAKIQQEEEAKKQAELANAEKPKKWDEGLTEQGKFILDKLSKGEDKDVYELLKNKFGYDNLSDEQKAMTYLSEKYPHLNHEDLAFKAAEEFGIGATEVDEDDLTDAQKAFIRKQGIDRKGLISEADKYFKDKAVNIEIPTLPNPLEEDEGYKEYQNFKKEQETLSEQQKQQELLDAKYEQETIERVNKTSLEIDALPIDLKIDLDQGEFVLESQFKLDDAKKKQLAEYAIEYVPTKAEFKAHQNQNGELDMKGYMTALANKLFAPQIQKALIKQAIAKDREEFTERELKNSTLRNNNNMQHSDQEVPFEISAMRQ